MPELPEVETVVRSLRARVAGRTFVDVETSGLALRSPVDRVALRAACRGQRVREIRRVGKYLLLDLANEHVVLAHLGMSGRMVVQPASSARPPHTHVAFLLDGDDELRYVDARRFGTLRVYRATDVAQAPELRALGPDPLSNAFTPSYLAAELTSSRSPIKNFLLDQRRIAGLGNIYVSEALHQAGVSPRRQARRVAGRALVIHHAIVEVLRSSVAHRGTTFRDYVDAEGSGGENQRHLRVYGREGAPCPTCKAPIRRIVQGARSTFFCPRCQH